MQAKAVAKYVRVSPRKARIVVDKIRGKEVVDALDILRFNERAISEVVSKVDDFYAAMEAALKDADKQSRIALSLIHI